MFFEKSGPVWEALRDLETRLQEAGIDHVVISGLSLSAHDYARQTLDVDIILTAEGFEAFRTRYEGAPYSPVEGMPRRFMDPRSGVAIDILIAGELAGHKGRNSSIRFPDPSEGEIREDLRTVSLARLIELKLVTWRYRDWGDVVELIRANGLAESFADRLDPTVRSAYGQCYDQANDPECGDA